MVVVRGQGGMISVDLIVKLPKSNGNDSVLTITDQGTTKAVILIPCCEDMSALGLAKVYVDRAFPYIGLPDRLISDRDTRLTSQLFREICNQLKIKQNISSAYHPQTDGSSERTNQTVETALRIFCNHQSNDWADWLPLVQYQINSHENSTTKNVPFEVWMGYTPRAHQPL
jgi:transposase InsO family protein